MSIVLIILLLVALAMLLGRPPGGPPGPSIVLQTENYLRALARRDAQLRKDRLTKW